MTRFTLIAAALAASVLPAAARHAPATEWRSTQPAWYNGPWPVAVRWWGQAFVTVETWWGLTVAIDPYDTGIGYDDPGVHADLVLITHEHRDHKNADLVRGTSHVLRGLGEDGRVRVVDLVLDRMPNDDWITLNDPMEDRAHTPHMVRVRTIASHHDDEQGARRGHNAMWLVEVDGVRILHCGDLGQPELTTGQLGQIGQVDVLLIPVGGRFTIDGAQAAGVVEQVRPRFVVPIHYKTEPLLVDLAGPEPFLEALPARYERREAVGNTLAVSAGLGPTREQPRVVELGYRPWQMPEPMARLWEGMEGANRDAQSVLEPLNDRQMNHRPGDGTHTVRWNVEHVAGRELGFFTRIYSNLDDSVPHIDLNPAQMPDDYEPAEPSWSGQEEARRLQRVADFTRRFAHMLDGKSLDERPAGSPWALERLLNTLAGHYGRHMENVRKKFDLEDWPVR